MAESNGAIVYCAGVLDGTGAPAILDAAVRIDGERITAVGPAAALAPPLPPRPIPVPPPAAVPIVPAPPPPRAAQPVPQPPVTKPAPAKAAPPIKPGEGFNIGDLAAFDELPPVN